MSVVHLIVATRSSGPPARDKIIKEMPGSVASGTSYTTYSVKDQCQLEISKLCINFCICFKVLVSWHDDDPSLWSKRFAI